VHVILGVSEQLKQLLATLHEDDSPGVPAGHGFGKLGLSATAQEFVPGKPFPLPSVERERSSAFSDAGSEAKAAAARLNTEAPEFVPSWQQAAAPAVSSDKKVWWYRDPAGVVRGPFSTTEMKAWSEKGYFSGGLEIALSDRGPYLPLNSVFPSPERPFWKSVEPREFATRMRQHILASRITE
jgi:hypothetical protein